jgi:hypothetical protein
MPKSKLTVSLFKPTKLEEYFGTDKNVCILLLLTLCMCVYVCVHMCIFTYILVHTSHIYICLKFSLIFPPIHSHSIHIRLYPLYMTITLDNAVSGMLYSAIHLVV